jgi:dTDP-glucose 4,6-dehydratase
LHVAVLGSGSFAAGDFVDLLLEDGRFDVLGIGRSPEKPNAFRPYAGRSRERFTYVQLDLNEDADALHAALDAFAPEYVVNYAAQGDDAASWAHPEDFFRTNCIALTRLVEYLKGRPFLRRFLQISSSSVYGAAPRNLAEETRLEPASPYGVSKAASDMLLLAYHAHYGFPAQFLRPPNLYGPHQQVFRIVPKAVIMLKRGAIIELHGGGHAVRSYLHVRDASRAALMILERGATGEAYNVAPDEKYRVRDVVAEICAQLGKDFRAVTTHAEDRPGQQSGQDLNTTKIRRLGWSPQVTLRRGIAGVIAWIERDWAELAGEPLVYHHVS